MLHFSHLARDTRLQHGITEVGDQPPSDIVRGEQVHKNVAAWVEHAIPRVLSGVDALATRQAGITLGVRVADCVPIVFADSQQGIVGTIHAGWRGTALDITRKTFEFLHARPLYFLVGLGPAICPQHFVVGEEVARQFDASVVRPADSDDGKFHVDLWQANVLQLIEAGVPERNIEVLRRCTFEDPTLHSFRREHSAARNVGFIFLK